MADALRALNSFDTSIYVTEVNSVSSMPQLGEYFREQILLDKEKYQWLVRRLAALKVQVRRIASFGCNDGRETLTLMCMLGASEAAGVDKEPQDIRNAQDTLQTIQNIIWAKHVPNDAPDFLKTPRLEQAVQFYQGDFVKRTQLLSDYYDIAFCDFVLHHIWLNQGGEDKTQAAIQEMARVVRPAGVVAARERTQRIGESAFEIDFAPPFERSGLRPMHMQTEPDEHGQYTEYLYLKDST